MFRNDHHGKNEVRFGEDQRVASRIRSLGEDIDPGRLRQLYRLIPCLYRYAFEPDVKSGLYEVENVRHDADVLPFAGERLLGQPVRIPRETNRCVLGQPDLLLIRQGAQTVLFVIAADCRHWQAAHEKPDA